MSKEEEIRQAEWMKFWEGYKTGRKHLATEIFVIMPIIIEKNKKNLAKAVMDYVYEVAKRG
jgi:hypothetical protein